MFNNLLPFLSFFLSIFLFGKFVSFMRLYCKIWCSRTGSRWTHNRAHALCVLDK